MMQELTHRSPVEPSTITTRNATTIVTNRMNVRLTLPDLCATLPPSVTRRQSQRAAHTTILARVVLARLPTDDKPAGLAFAKKTVEVALEVGGGATDVKVSWTMVEYGKGREKDGMYEWVRRVAARNEMQLMA